MPEEISDNVVIYSKSEGAQIVVTKYGDRYVSEFDYKELASPEVGDVSRAFQSEETNSGGGKRVWITVMFSYRNVYHAVELWGWKDEVSIKQAVEIANKLFNRLERLPLSDTVTFTP